MTHGQESKSPKALAADLRKRLRQVDQLTGRSNERDRDTRRKRELRAASKDSLDGATHGRYGRSTAQSRDPTLSQAKSRQAVDSGLLPQSAAIIYGNCGFAEITRPTFDQEHLKLWQQAGGEPARPDQFAVAQYVYGWG